MVASISANSRIKVAICATHPIQYQVPLWRRLALQEGLTVRVFYGSDMSIRGYQDEGFGTAVKWDQPLVAGYEAEFLSTDPRINRVGFQTPSGVGITRAMARFGPDVVVITAYNSAFHLRSLRAARIHRAATVMRHEASDSTVHRSMIKGWIRDLVLKMFYSRVDRFAAIGTNAVRHLRRLGVPQGRIGRSPYCVDTEFFAREVGRLEPFRNEHRRAFGISEDQIAFVFSGKLIPKKDPLLLPAALRLLTRGELEQIHVLVAGDGELRTRLREELRQLLGERAHLLGFVNQAEIGRVYNTGDFLVLPSRKGGGETWGLAVNEGMQFGLPAVVSDGVGCHPDLVIPNDTGWTFKSMDPSDLAGVFRMALATPTSKKSQMAKAAATHVRSYSIQAAAAGLVEELNLALESRKQIASNGA